MALKKTVTTVHGFDAVDAYHRVENISFAGKDRITFFVRSYKEVCLPSFNDQFFNCVYDMNGSNPIQQAYEHLKTIEEFIGALDC